MKNIFIIIILAITITGCSYERPTNERIKEVLNEYVADGYFNGSIMVAHKDSIIYQGSFGYANIDTKDTISTSTLFAVGSVTKQFTATAVMILQEKGLLSINDIIGNYLKVPSTMHNIPIKHFMSMTSGIFNYWENDIPCIKDSILDFHFNGDTMYFATNTKYHYNNSNYYRGWVC